MHIGRGIPQGRETGLRSSTTTGQVWSDIVLNEGGTRALTMYFAPGSRTHWHRHEGGQLLYTIAGEGWIQERDGESATLGPGDVCWAEPGVEHWHGAAPGSHLIQLAVHFGHIDWGSQVGDDEYRLP